LQTTIIRYTVDDNKIRAMMESQKKSVNGKKSRFQQRYEQLMKQAEEQQKQQNRKK
jgi:YidC/Oxa1 family membrane protein insertase